MWKVLLDIREMQKIEVKKVHLMKVVTDYAGEQNLRNTIFRRHLDPVGVRGALP